MQPQRTTLVRHVIHDVSSSKVGLQWYDTNADDPLSVSACPYLSVCIAYFSHTHDQDDSSANAKYQPILSYVEDNTTATDVWIQTQNHIAYSA